jgi:hypothetical protein
MLSHLEAAELLFAAERTPHDPDLAAALITEQYAQHHGERSHFADELATEYARHPHSAAAHMTACLAAAPDQLELPDWPERDAYSQHYTGLGDEDYVEH